MRPIILSSPQYGRAHHTQSASDRPRILLSLVALQFSIFITTYVFLHIDSKVTGILTWLQVALER